MKIGYLILKMLTILARDQNMINYCVNNIYRFKILVLETNHLDLYMESNIGLFFNQTRTNVVAKKIK